MGGIPIFPAGYIEKIYTDQRIVIDGLQIDTILMTDKQFKSVDFPNTYQRHKIQSRVSEKYSLTLYAKENTNIELLKIANDITFFMQDGTRLNPVIIDVTKERLAPSYTYRYLITFYNRNLDMFEVNNYLTSDYLLQQSYSSRLVKCVATGNKGFYSPYIKLGTSSLPTTSNFEPFYFYSNNNIYIILPVNSITTTMKDTGLDLNVQCMKPGNAKFVLFSPRSYNDNYIRIGCDDLADETGFTADEMIITWEKANAINLTYYTKLLTQTESSEVKEKKSENTAFDLVNSSVNSQVTTGRFYLNRADMIVARSYLPRAQEIYFEYNSQKIYAYERPVIDIPKKDDLIDIFEANIIINHNQNYFYNFE